MDGSGWEYAQIEREERQTRAQVIRKCKIAICDHLDEVIKMVNDKVVVDHLEGIKAQVKAI